MTTRNRKSESEAAALRLRIANILWRTNQLVRLTAKDIRHMLGPDAPSLDTINTHLKWIRDEYERDRLRSFLIRWNREASQQT